MSVRDSSEPVASEVEAAHDRDSVKAQRHKVTYGYTFPDLDTFESLRGHAGRDLVHHPENVGAVVERSTLSIEWSFQLTDEEVARFYNMMQMITGVDMEMACNIDQGVLKEGERYRGVPTKRELLDKLTHTDDEKQMAIAAADLATFHDFSIGDIMKVRRISIDVWEDMTEILRDYNVSPEVFDRVGSI